VLRVSADEQDNGDASVKAFRRRCVDPTPVAAKNGLCNQRLIAACYDSAKIGQAVEINF
jgi:hypothetical protein